MQGKLISALGTVLLCMPACLASHSTSLAPVQLYSGSTSAVSSDQFRRSDRRSDQFRYVNGRHVVTREHTIAMHATIAYVPGVWCVRSAAVVVRPAHPLAFSAKTKVCRVLTMHRQQHFAARTAASFRCIAHIAIHRKRLGSRS
jgi:hypothetical protein